jgi:hypothetical protein
MLDGLLGQYRGVALSAVAACVMVAPWADATFSLKVLSPFSSLLFVILSIALLLARINGLRDDNGWQWDLVERSLVDGRDALRELWDRLLNATPGQRLCDLGKIFFSCGLLLGATANVVLPFDADIAESAKVVAAILLGLGLFQWFAGWRLLVGQGRSSHVAVDETDIRSLESAVRKLPPLIDCRHPNTSAVVAGVRQGLVRRFLEEVSNWEPGARGAEREYEMKLLRRLKRKMPETFPARQQKITADRLRGRVDLVVGRYLSVELKAGLENKTADGTTGQIRRYAKILRGRGPLFLLLCRTDRTFAEVRVVPEIEALRREGCAVVAVLAA